MSYTVLTECFNQTWSEVRIVQHLSVAFAIQDSLKQRYTLLPVLFNFVLECAIRKVQENQKGLVWNGRRQLLGCADDIDILSENMNTSNKNEEAIR